MGQNEGVTRLLDEGDHLERTLRLGAQRRDKLHAVHVRVGQLDAAIGNNKRIGAAERHVLCSRQGRGGIVRRRVKRRRRENELRGVGQPGQRDARRAGRGGEILSDVLVCARGRIRVPTRSDPWRGTAKIRPKSPSAAAKRPRSRLLVDEKDVESECAVFCARAGVAAGGFQAGVAGRGARRR